MLLLNSGTETAKKIRENWWFLHSRTNKIPVGIFILLFLVINFERFQSHILLSMGKVSVLFCQNTNFQSILLAELILGIINTMFLFIWGLIILFYGLFCDVLINRIYFKWKRNSNDYFIPRLEFVLLCCWEFNTALKPCTSNSTFTWTGNFTLNEKRKSLSFDEVKLRARISHH